ncbi:HAMP domain-containing histidine kinase [Vibrio sp. HDW18]|uniref:sensor histidine kinase n=1 Tax=Vibrio sp. HDW18 TaxID=2714948 RepID=UPI0014072B3D|nr:HAMP domain-containing sensor histidine kinase [Vibrio sp. HDW18]QIL84599.1 HAMP domain-containing histidine kinase [Vibrio sp. HDW18]
MAKATDCSPKRLPSLYNKIRLTFLLLTSLMFAIFWSLIYIAEEQIEIISLEHKLATETREYQRNYQRFGDKAPLPDVHELATYWSKESLPDWLQAYQQSGFYEHQLGEEDKHFLISAHPSGQGLLYVVYQDDADDFLDNYEDRLHLLVLSLGVGLLLFIIAYGLYFVRLLSAPFLDIERKISGLSPEQPAFVPSTPYRETRHIEQTLLENKAHIAAYFTREQEFSRFASHELRTPIMVIQGSTELLKKIPRATTETQQRIVNKAITRIDYAGQQMKTLTEAFLLLGKAQIETQHYDHIDLAARLEQLVDEMARNFVNQQLSYQLVVKQNAMIWAPVSFVDIVIGNLIKNAFNYSAGDIEIRLENSQLTIINPLDSSSVVSSGYGCGLIIVERICERMAWLFTRQTQAEQYWATIDFIDNHA